MDGNLDGTNRWDIGAYETVDPGVDTDADGLPDCWEHQYWGNIRSGEASMDDDQDGIANRGEYIADLDPTNPLSRLELTGLEPLPLGMRVSWRGGQLARQYLDIRTNLGSTSEQWAAIFTNLPPTAMVTNIIDAGATNATLFYRIRVER